MDKNELKHRLEAAEKQNLGLLDEIKNLKEKLAEMQDEPEIPDFPEFNCMDVAYQMDSCFDVMEEKHGGGKGDKDFTGDDAMFYSDFHTEDYAQEFRKKCLLIAMILHCKWYLDRDYVPDWKNSEERKYFVCYDYVDGCFKYGMDHSFNGCSISFGTDVAARKCAEWLNKHWRKNDEESV